MSILEVVTFELVDGVNDTDFLESNVALNEWVQKQPGFEYRALSFREDKNTWTDSVFWKDIDCAKAAQQAFGDVPELAPLMQMIKKDSVDFSHQPLFVQLLAGAK